MPDIYERLRVFLDTRQVPYRLLVHSAEGRSDRVAAIRGNRREQGAKAMVIQLRSGRSERRHCLAVLPGDRRVDLARLRAACAARSATLAPAEVAEELTGCVIGAIPPFSFDDALPLIVDPTLLDNDEIVFNAGRLDRSICLGTRAYLEVAAPRIAPIAEVR